MGFTTLRPGQRLVAPNVRIIQPSKAAAATSWWLSGGISAANCIAAYAPKGAASLSASYSNLNNPGTNDAAPGVAPSFASATGWSFDASTKYLITTIVTPSSPTWSYIVRYTGGDAGSLIGCTDGTNGLTMFPNRTSARSYANYTQFGGFTPATSGVMAIAGNTAYLNGVAESGTITAGTNPNKAIWIGGRNFNGVLNQPTAASIQAFAIYNTTLNSTQISALTTAIQAL